MPSTIDVLESVFLYTCMKRSSSRTSKDRRTLKCRVNSFRSIVLLRPYVVKYYLRWAIRTTLVAFYTHSRTIFWRRYICLCQSIALENEMEQFFRDGQRDECIFTLTNMYLCSQTSVMDEEKRQQFLQETSLNVLKSRTLRTCESQKRRLAGRQTWWNQWIRV